MLALFTHSPLTHRKIINTHRKGSYTLARFNLILSAVAGPPTFNVKLSH